jgi:hypothetical protein
VWAAPGKRGPAGEKENGLGPKKQWKFQFIQIIFKRARIILIKRWTYQAPNISNKICIWSFWSQEQFFLLEHSKMRARIWIKIEEALGFEIQSNLVEFEWNFQELEEFDWGAPDYT